jgi:hypothetical protein
MLLYTRQLALGFWSNIIMSERKVKAAVYAAAKSATTTLVEESVEMIDPDIILLDGFNPRITPILMAEGITPDAATQKQIADAIVKSREWRSGRGGFTTPFNDFLNAVIKDGRINEPPVVQRLTNGKIKVLHGNNRALAAKKAKKIAQGNGFDHIKCRVLPHDTPEAEIQKYMRIAHNPNTKQADWHPAVHGHTLYSLASAEIGGIGSMTSREMQQEFGKGPKTIKDIVQAYAAMQKYIADTGDRRPLHIWAAFHEIYRNPGVLAMYESDSEFRETIHTILPQKTSDGFQRLNAEDVKYLPKIKEDDEAWEVLVNGDGSMQAAKMVRGDVESKNNFDRIDKLTKIINEVANSMRVKGIKKNPVERKSVTDLATAVRNLLDKANMAELLELASA